MTMTIETFSLKDAREYVETQLDMDAKRGDHLTVDEYMRMMELLVQLEQAESLKRIADVQSKQLDLIAQRLSRIGTVLEKMDR